MQYLIAVGRGSMRREKLRTCAQKNQCPESLKNISASSIFYLQEDLFPCTAFSSGTVLHSPLWWLKQESFLIFTVIHTTLCRVINLISPDEASERHSNLLKIMGPSAGPESKFHWPQSSNSWFQYNKFIQSILWSEWDLQIIKLT